MEVNRHGDNFSPLWGADKERWSETSWRPEAAVDEAYDNATNQENSTSKKLETEVAALQEKLKQKDEAITADAKTITNLKH